MPEFDVYLRKLIVVRVEADSVDEARAEFADDPDIEQAFTKAHPEVISVVGVLP